MPVRSGLLTDNSWADVVFGYAALNMGGYWRGVIEGNRYCPEKRRTSEEALVDARKFYNIEFADR